MQYVPNRTTFNAEMNTYDLESWLIMNVKASHHFIDGEKESPEFQFIALLDVPLEKMQERIKKYFDSVTAWLQMLEGMVDYLTLAESRRRIYWPIPLNKFALTLPYAVKYGHPHTARFEMTEEGEVVPMADHGMRFYFNLTSTQNDGSLTGFDPHVIPAPEEGGAGNQGFVHLIKEERNTATQKQDPGHQKMRGCPYRQVKL
jgi:hypothetical protein